jgi:hypothetical protein
VPANEHDELGDDELGDDELDDDELDDDELDDLNDEHGPSGSGGEQ